MCGEESGRAMQTTLGEENGAENHCGLLQRHFIEAECRIPRIVFPRHDLQQVKTWLLSV